MVKLSRSFITFIVFLFIPFHAYATPRVEIDQTDFSAGEVMKGEKIIHDFVVKNTGDEPLVIKAFGC